MGREPVDGRWVDPLDEIEAIVKRKRKKRKEHKRARDKKRAGGGIGLPPAPKKRAVGRRTPHNQAIVRARQLRAVANNLIQTHQVLDEDDPTHKAVLDGRHLGFFMGAVRLPKEVAVQVHNMAKEFGVPPYVIVAEGLRSLRRSGSSMAQLEYEARKRAEDRKEQLKKAKEQFQLRESARKMQEQALLQLECREAEVTKQEVCDAGECQRCDDSGRSDRSGSQGSPEAGGDAGQGAWADYEGEDRSDQESA